MRWIMTITWIYLESSPKTLSIWYDDYYNKDNPNEIKRVWSDGFVEYYEAE